MTAPTYPLPGTAGPGQPAQRQGPDAGPGALTQQAPGGRIPDTQAPHTPGEPEMVPGDRGHGSRPGLGDSRRRPDELPAENTKQHYRMYAGKTAHEIKMCPSSVSQLSLNLLRGFLTNFIC